MRPAHAALASPSSATVISGMRLEKLHSLSHQDQASRPETFVRAASKFDIMV
jgi:hypothetical protein